MKRKEKEAYWSARIDEYQNSELALSEWCETAEVAVHNIKSMYQAHTQFGNNSELN